MSERHLSQAIRRAMRLEALDAVAQRRNHACAGAAHTHRSSKNLDRLSIQREPEAGSFVHDMF
jgi:hypothetical protein